MVVTVAKEGRAEGFLRGLFFRVSYMATHGLT